MTLRCAKCHKRAFASHLEVRWAILIEYRRGSHRLRFYECPHTPGTWHLTHLYA